MVRPGVTTRKPRVKRELPGRRTAFIVCHAISMAMTVVLPAPVASLSARRISSGFASLFAFFRWSRIAFPASVSVEGDGVTRAPHVSIMTRRPGFWW